MRTRDAAYLATLCLVLAVWGWDRGRLAIQLEELPPMAITAPPRLIAVPDGGTVLLNRQRFSRPRTLRPLGSPAAFPEQSASDPFGPGSDAPPAGVFAGDGR